MSDYAQYETTQRAVHTTRDHRSQFSLADYGLSLTKIASLSHHNANTSIVLQESAYPIGFDDIDLDICLAQSSLKWQPPFKPKLRKRHVPNLEPRETISLLEDFTLPDITAPLSAKKHIPSSQAIR